MSVRHLPLTLLMLVISASPLLLMWLFAYVSYAQFTSILIMLFILMGFSTLAYWKSKIFVKIFDRKKRRVVTEDEPFDLYDIELSDEDFAAE